MKLGGFLGVSAATDCIGSSMLDNSKPSAYYERYAVSLNRLSVTPYGFDIFTAQRCGKFVIENMLCIPNELLRFKK